LMGDDSDPEPLLAAQREAREAKRGIWALPEFQKELYITSFHANGRGKDADNPNVEYFRMVNISEHPINLEGYTVTNEAGRKFTLPAVEVAPGRSVVIASGQADDPEGGAAIHLGSSEPIWNNEGDTLTLRNPAGEIVIERDYAGQPLHLDRLPNPVSQARVRRLGLDVDV